MSMLQPTVMRQVANRDSVRKFLPTIPRWFYFIRVFVHRPYPDVSFLIQSCYWMCTSFSLSFVTKEKGILWWLANNKELLVIVL